jgi:uncharacterized lipoprotein YddW (UPF0748 family)
MTMLSIALRQTRRIRAAARRPRFALSLALAMTLAVGCTPTGPTATTGPGAAPGAAERIVERVGPLRAVWVVRTTYHDPSDIERVMDNAKSLGLNAVMFQVRGNGTVLYPSDIEPWSREFDGRDPGFDPLATAIRAAHERGLELHAWVNAMPAWRGPHPPGDPRQLYNAHPEWFWYDQKEQRQPLTYRRGDRDVGWYVSLNPCLPEVRRYLVDGVFREIARKYPIDGLHLDYIRFPNETNARGVDYPYDRATLGRYRSETGKSPADDPHAWDRWRTDCVSAVVRDTRAMLRRERPRAELSASVGPDPDRAREHHFQDGAAWARNGWVDFLCPMDYTADQATFTKRIRTWRSRVTNVPLAVGIGIFAHKTFEQSKTQLELADRWGQGFCLFSYGSFFGRGDDTRATGEAARKRRARRLALEPVLRRIAGADS